MMKWIEKVSTPKVQVYMALGIVITSVIGWPVSALTIAKDEPAVILGISWLALIYSGVSALFAAMADLHIVEQSGKK